MSLEKEHYGAVFIDLLPTLRGIFMGRNVELELGLVDTESYLNISTELVIEVSGGLQIRLYEQSEELSAMDGSPEHLINAHILFGNEGFYYFGLEFEKNLPPLIYALEILWLACHGFRSVTTQFDEREFSKEVRAAAAQRLKKLKKEFDSLLKSVLTGKDYAAINLANQIYKNRPI